MSSYLSIVTVGRNDGHGGDYLSRLQNSFNSVIVNDKFHSLNAEYVFVEWGNPDEQLGMEDAIDWGTTLPVRIIKVPRELIDNIPNPDKLFLFPHAINVGVRRASGDFILTTSSDVIFSLDMVQFLAAGELNSGAYYRINLIRTKDGKVSVIHYSTPGAKHYGAAGDFILMSKKNYHEIRGYPEINWYNATDGMTVHLAATLGLEEITLPYDVFHPEHGNNDYSKVVKFWDDYNPWAVKNDEGWGFSSKDFKEILRGKPS